MQELEYQLGRNLNENIAKSYISACRTLVIYLRTYIEDENMIDVLNKLNNTLIDVRIKINDPGPYPKNYTVLEEYESYREIIEKARKQSGLILPQEKEVKNPEQYLEGNF